MVNANKLRYNFIAKITIINETKDGKKYTAVAVASSLPKQTVNKRCRIVRRCVSLPSYIKQSLKTNANYYI